MDRLTWQAIIDRSEQGIKPSLSELIKCQYHSEGIHLKALQRVKSDQVGGKTSRLRGRGMDFSEVRAYQPGDEIRHVDWRVTARTGKTHTKLFVEERERPVLFVVDQSSTMFFATQVAYKSYIAAKACAMLAWAAARQGDRVGGIVYQDNDFRCQMPRAGTAGVLPLLRQIALCEKMPTPEQSAKMKLSEVLRQLQRMVKPGSLVCILSDFYDVDAEAQQQLRLLRKSNDILALRVNDIIELTPPPQNCYSISDGNHTGLLDMRSERVRDDYFKLFTELEQTLQQDFQQLHIPLVKLLTHESLSERLRYYFPRHKGNG